jgi:hypothetical protein
MFGFAVVACSTSKYLPSLVGLLFATAIAVGCVIFMVHEGRKQTKKPFKVACIIAGIVLAPIVWLLVAQAVMPSGCLF